ncbi:MAG: hypothetical protein HQL55_17695, partial [Magnetococcales bacterium]|nr:hypothetical protein [Magnetococcales bacterium]
MSFSSVVILGAGGHGKVVLEVCQAAGLQVAGFVDPGFEVGFRVLNLPVLGGNELFSSPDFIQSYQFILGMGNLAMRRQIIPLLREKGVSLATAIHPNAVISPSAMIHAGTVVMAGAVVNAEAVIG